MCVQNGCFHIVEVASCYLLAGQDKMTTALGSDLDRKWWMRLITLFPCLDFFCNDMAMAKTRFESQEILNIGNIGIFAY
jgi:hypothetical protein